MNDLPRLIWLPALLVCAVGLGMCSQRHANSGGTAAARSQELPGGGQLSGAAEFSGPASGSAIPLTDRPGDGIAPRAHGDLPRESSAGQASAFAQQRSRSGSERARAIDGSLQTDLVARVQAALGRVSKESGGRAKGSECTVAFRLIDLETGQVIAEQDPLHAVESASNMKLVTTMAALVALGPQFEFETVAEASGPVEDGTLHGDLLVRASGDPLYNSSGGEAAKAELGRLARGVAENGIRHVTGDLVLDSEGFVEPGPAPGWPKPEGFWTASYGLASPFSLQGGLVTMLCSPRGEGQLCEVELTPWPCGLDLKASVAGVSGRGNDVRLGLVDVRRDLGVSGTYGASNPPFAKEFRHPAPAEMFAAALRDELARAGVSIAGSNQSSFGKPAGRPIAVLRRPWISLIEPINTDSVNSVADSLLIAMGHERFGIGSREQGARAVRDVLKDLGVDLTGFYQADGSGLSRDNRVHAQLLSELLVRSMELPGVAGDRFLASLALAGETGTLERRMLDGSARGRVRAKTGWIQGASSLSGIAETLRGRQVAFSMLVNYPRVSGLNNTVWKPMLDDLCERMVRDGAGTVR